MRNPILAGFNPDPSICRRGDDFYLATSSFQWWPGVPIYHSRDLKHWRLVSYGLTRTSQLDMRRIGDSCGIWAPCLSFAEGLFWLVFTNASGPRPRITETPNYVVTAPEVTGPWSEPVYLNSRGNDPSLFHDDDGRKYLVCTNFVRCPGKSAHRGALLQEYSPDQQKLVGPARVIFKGTDLGVLEGSKLFKRDGWYYSVVAEGGTHSNRHAATMARSRDIWGPYEVHPQNPILTALGSDSPVAYAGHADIVTVAGTRAAVVYLACRPVDGRSVLGRETHLAAARWCDDGWLRLDSSAPLVELPEFALHEEPLVDNPPRDDFDEPALSLEWNSLRSPIDDRVDLASRPGWLVLTPSPSPIDSLDRPSLVAQRIRHHKFSAETVLDFQPRDIQQWAGLVCYYDSLHWYFLHRQFDEVKGAAVALYARRKWGLAYEDLGVVPIDDVPVVRLGVDCAGRFFRFRYALGVGGQWRRIGERQDALVLSDEHISESPFFAFTGAMIGLAAHDATEQGPVAAFDWFEYMGADVWPDIATA